MQLVIDLGNTRLKWAIVSSGAITMRGAFAHDASEVASALDSEWTDIPAVQRILVASVASLGLDTEIEAFARRRFHVDAEFLRSPALALGVRNAYAEPERLGIDRFLGLAALHAAQPRAQVLISVGTAMTLDALGADGTHLGGWIVPSPTLMRESVMARTARVAATDGRLADFADNTADALQSGSLHAASGAAEHFCANAARRFLAWPAVVLAGGGAEDLAPLLRGAERRSDLVIDGLALWATGQSPEIARGAR